jgi:hypothetical protein
MDPATRIGGLVVAGNAQNVFGVLRDHVTMPDTLAVVYVSGSFVRETLKCGDDTSIEALETRLRELGIYARGAVHYPSEPATPTQSPPVVP